MRVHAGTLPRGMFSGPNLQHNPPPSRGGGLCRGQQCEAKASGQPGGAALAQLVTGVVRRRLVIGALAGQRGKLALHLAPDPAYGDTEDSLSALDEVERFREFLDHVSAEDFETKPDETGTAG